MRFWVSRAGMAVALAASVLRPAHGQDFDAIHDFATLAGTGPSGRLLQGVTAGCAGGGP